MTLSSKEYDRMYDRIDCMMQYDKTPVHTGKARKETRNGSTGSPQVLINIIYIYTCTHMAIHPYIYIHINAYTYV